MTRQGKVATALAKKKPAPALSLPPLKKQPRPVSAESASTAVTGHYAALPAAPLWRRLAALVYDGLLLIALGALALVAGVALAWWITRSITGSASMGNASRCAVRCPLTQNTQRLLQRCPSCISNWCPTPVVVTLVASARTLSSTGSVRRVAIAPGA